CANCGGQVRRADGELLAEMPHAIDGSFDREDRKRRERHRRKRCEIGTEHAHEEGKQCACTCGRFYRKAVTSCTYFRHAPPNSRYLACSGTVATWFSHSSRSSPAPP